MNIQKLRSLGAQTLGSHATHLVMSGEGCLVLRVICRYRYLGTPSNASRQNPSQRSKFKLAVVAAYQRYFVSGNVYSYCIVLMYA